MKKYVGAVQVLAAPMTRQEYNDYRGWILPDDEDGSDEGYLLEGIGQLSNHENHEGHITWKPEAVFESTYKLDNRNTLKTLHNSDVSGTEKNVEDVSKVGNVDMFTLLCKASSDSEGWMKSTKACEITGVGCIVQVTTQQRNVDFSYSVAEAVTFVPNTKIKKDGNGGAELVCSDC